MVNEKLDNDSELMIMICQGNKKAMRILVDKYKKKAYFLALSRVGNSDEAYDISQEAFIRVFKSADRFDTDLKFFPWFFSIVNNLCFNVLQRRESHDSKKVDINDVDFLLIDNSNPETSMIKKEEARRLRKAIMMLDIGDRKIIMLKHFQDLSYDEIAVTLEIPKGTVMSRLYYARKKLAKLLDERV